jgi:uncharacterized membrane protein (UPF0182 family)
MTSPTRGGKKWMIRLGIGAGSGILLIALAVLGSVLGIDYLVDIWWFDALGYGFYYWQRMLYRYGVFAVVTLLFFLIFFSNFWIAARFLKKVPVEADAAGQSRSRKLLRHFQTASIWFYGPLSLALSIPIALPLFKRWESVLFYVFGDRMGVSDPFLGKDVAFYLFSFPIYTLIQSRLLLALAVLAVGLVILYLIKNRLLQQPLLAFSRGAKWHLSLLVCALFGIEIWDFMLQRYALVYDASHQAIFHGPGYVQMKVVLPLIWACMAFLAATAVALIVVLQLRKGYKTCAVFILAFLSVLGLRYTDFLPRQIQTYVVKPNEIDKESPYIAKHIQATLDAYKLTDLEVRNFTHERLPADKAASQVQEVLRNIPVWDAETLADVFLQLQELRTYYFFPLVSVGRYNVQNRRQQVFLSPREIEFSNLPGGARNWINEHMTYTHGFGVVMTPASQVSGDAMTWYLHNIPPESQFGLTIEQPRIYYGMGTYTYSIVPNRAGEMDYPKGDINATTDYSGRGGVKISSLFRKFLFAYHLKNKNIFFSTKITDQSKLLFRRNILERIRHLVPFLQLDQTPYVAVTPKGIYWIVDAYTTADSYPASAPLGEEERSFNYIRNAVKIVVDAYHGSVNLYIYDEEDPIIRAYDRIYPGLFKTKAQLPADLRARVRYPKDLFDIQMRIYAKYHQTDPQLFYQQEDLWTFAEALGDNNTVPRQPYYVTLDLIESGKLDFMLLLPMFPKDRDNLRAMAIAGCDPENYGKLIITNFPKGELVYGPAQIDALINQDPEIAEQFTLWDQAGSQIVRGKMIILPLGNSVLFIQPVYLKATSRVSIPKLQRIIMSEGETVVMETSIQKAYDELKRRVDGQAMEENEAVEPSMHEDEKMPEPTQLPPAEQQQPEMPDQPLKTDQKPEAGQPSPPKP